MPVAQKTNGATMRVIGMIAAVMAVIAAIGAPSFFVFREMHEDLKGLAELVKTLETVTITAVASVEDHARDKRGSLGGDIEGVERELEEARIHAARLEGMLDERTRWLEKLQDELRQQ